VEHIRITIVPHGTIARPQLFGASTKEKKMADERFEWISRRAYAIWEAAGRPWGCSQHHWEQAVKEREIMERTRASADGEEILARFRKPTAKHRADDDDQETEERTPSGARRAG
jgi:allantoicase